MISKEKFFKDIEKDKILFIIRNNSYKTIIKLSNLIWELDYKFLEITLNSNPVCDALEELSKSKPTNAYLGVGTVKYEKEVEKLNNYNISFIVTPIFSPSLTKKILNKNYIPIIGGFTPTEILMAKNCGCDLVKVFPANSPKYIKTIKGPLDDVKMLAVGGVNNNNILDFLSAGATAVALGGSFFEFDINGNYDEIRIKDKLQKLKEIISNRVL